MDIIEIVKAVILKFANALPNVIGAIIVIFIGWLFSKLIAKSFKKIFEALNLNRYSEKLNQTDFAIKANFKLDLNRFLSKIIYYILLLITIMAATDVLGMPFISKMMSDLIAYLPRLLSAIALFIVGIYISEFVKKIVHGACASINISSGPIIANFVFYLIFLTLTVSALAQASIETGLITSNLTVILAGLVAAFAIGYGFASRDTMANFIASFYSKNKVKIGDVIAIDGSKGKVISIDNTSITLQDDDKIVVIPLKKLTSEKIEIYSGDKSLPE